MTRWFQRPHRMRGPVPVAGVLLLAGLAGARGASAQQIPVRLGGTPSSFVGLPFDLPLEVDLSGRAERLGSFAMSLRWNPAVLQFLGGRDGNFGSLTTNEDSIGAGLLRLAAANPAGVGGQVVIGVAHFVPLAASADTFRLDVTELYAASTFSDLRPAAVWSDQVYCPAIGRYGDVDGNDVVNSADALAALTHSVGRSITGNPAAGDVDADGLTNARDALIILANAVGLDVGEFRLLVPFPGACAAGEPPLLSVLPGFLTLDVAQVARYTAVARNPAGATVAVTDLVWESSDQAVATVDTAGVVTAVAPGTATIRVFRPGGDLATAGVTVLNRRTHWVDAFASPAEEDQLGAPELPFRTIQQGLAFARPGDTVRVRPRRYEEALVISQDVVVQGDTTPEGVRPRVVPGDYTTGILVLGGRDVALVNLALDGFLTGVETSATLDTLDTLLLDGLRISLPAGSCANTAVRVDTLNALIVRRSRLVGDGQDLYGCGSGVSVDRGVPAVVLEDDRISDFGWYGVYLNSADTVTVRRSAVSDNYFALTVQAVGATPALVVEESRFERNYASGLYAQNLRSAVIAHSVFDDPLYYDDAINVNGNGSGYLKVVGDSIRAIQQSWIAVSALDSVVVDSVHVWGQTGGGYFSDVRLVRVTRSSFDEMYASNAAIQASAGAVPGQLLVDSVRVTGSSDCSQCGYAVWTSGIEAAVNRLTAQNLYYGVYVTDSAATVTNSTFADVFTGVYAYSGAATPRLTVSGTRITGAYYGIESYNAVTVVDNVDLLAGPGSYRAVYTYGTGADTVRNSTVIGHEYALDLSGSTAYVAGNTVLGPRFGGIYHYGSGLAADTTVILNNVVQCDAYGALNADGLDAGYSNYLVQGNTVSGCVGTVRLESLTGFEVAVRGNTLTIPSQADYPGVWVGSGARARVVGNVIDGGAPNAEGSVYLLGGPYARVDSNTIRNALHGAVRSYTVDSLYLRGNLIEDVAEACCSADWAGIAASNTQYQLVIEGNTLRRIHGRGIWINQSRVGTDTARAQVSGNAISGADSAGVYVNLGTLVMLGNNVRNNASYGLRVVGYDPTTLEVHGNAFQGNGLYAVSSEGDANVNATGNWWGVDGAAPGTAGADSVFGPVDGTSPLPSEPSVPALAPVGLIASAPSATAVRLPVPAALPLVERRALTGTPVEAPRRPPVLMRAPTTPAVQELARRTRRIADLKAVREAERAGALKAGEDARTAWEAATAARRHADRRPRP